MNLPESLSFTDKVVRTRKKKCPMSPVPALSHTLLFPSSYHCRQILKRQQISHDESCVCVCACVRTMCVRQVPWLVPTHLNWCQDLERSPSALFGLSRTEQTHANTQTQTRLSTPSGFSNPPLLQAPGETLW